MRYIKMAKHTTCTISVMSVHRTSNAVPHSLCLVRHEIYQDGKTHDVYDEHAGQDSQGAAVKNLQWAHEVGPTYKFDKLFQQPTPAVVNKDLIMCLVMQRRVFM
jgi:hypothetical protein